MKQKMFRHVEETRTNSSLVISYITEEDKSKEEKSYLNKKILQEHNIKKLTIYYDNYEPIRIIMIIDAKNSGNCYNIIDTEDLPNKKSTELFNKIGYNLYEDPLNYNKYINKINYNRRKNLPNPYQPTDSQESLIRKTPLHIKLLVLYITLFLFKPNNELIKLIKDICYINNIYLNPKRAIQNERIL